MGTPLIMPTLTAATWERMGSPRNLSVFSSESTACLNAMNAPVMEAVRVPPSASITSQSIQICRSPSFSSSIEARNARPISRWISWVRPDFFPAVDSRGVRTLVARGSMEYSEVIQPLLVPFRKRGTVSSTVAVQITRVCPISIKADPSACAMNPGVIRTDRNWLAGRPSSLILAERSSLRVV